MTLSANFHQTSRIAGIIMLVAGGAGLASAFSQGMESFIHAYFYGWLVFTGAVFGCTGLQLLHHATRAKWSAPQIRDSRDQGGIVKWLSRRGGGSGRRWFGVGLDDQCARAIAPERGEQAETVVSPHVVLAREYGTCRFLGENAINKRLDDSVRIRLGAQRHRQGEQWNAEHESRQRRLGVGESQARMLHALDRCDTLAIQPDREHLPTRLFQVHSDAQLFEDAKQSAYVLCFVPLLQCGEIATVKIRFPGEVCLR